MADLTKTIAPTRTLIGRVGVSDAELRTELVRKALHTLIALVPTLAALIGRDITVVLLASGTLFYAFSEQLRISGRRVLVVTRLTLMAAREKDRGHFVLGPITLGIGAMLSMLLYPAPAAAIAIYALAFGDGLSSLSGKMFGRFRIPLTGGKTLEGSATCFAAVLLSSYLVLGRLDYALAVAAAATLLEAMPTQDLDNIVLPLGVGLIARFFVT